MYFRMTCSAARFFVIDKPTKDSRLFGTMTTTAVCLSVFSQKYKIGFFSMGKSHFFAARNWMASFTTIRQKAFAVNLRVTALASPWFFLFASWMTALTSDGSMFAEKRKRTYGGMVDRHEFGLCKTGHASVAKVTILKFLIVFSMRLFVAGFAAWIQTKI